MSQALSKNQQSFSQPARGLFRGRKFSHGLETDEFRMGCGLVLAVWGFGAGYMLGEDDQSISTKILKASSLSLAGGVFGAKAPAVVSAMTISVILGGYVVAANSSQNTNVMQK